jgi:hypothetical protein
VSIGPGTSLGQYVVKEQIGQGAIAIADLIWSSIG